jgi:hypothetical protein
VLGNEATQVVHLEANVDWLTMTLPSSDSYSAQAYDDIMGYLGGKGFEREQPRQVNNLGYNGVQIGKVYFGQREDGIILRA